MRSKLYRVGNQLPHAPENVLRDIYADEQPTEPHHFAFNAAEIKAAESKELAKLKKSARSLRAGHTWYSVSFQRICQGGFKISVDKRTITGPVVFSLNIEDRTMYGLIGVAQKDSAGSAFYPAGCHRLAPDWHKVEPPAHAMSNSTLTLVMGGRKLKPLLRKMRYLADLNAREIARHLDEEYEFYESMYVDWR